MAINAPHYVVNQLTMLRLVVLWLYEQVPCSYRCAARTHHPSLRRNAGVYARGSCMSLTTEQHLDEGIPSLTGVRVIVVEDSWHVVKALRSALEQMGMDVIGVASTTAAARRLVAEHAPTIAVVDVNLSGDTSCTLIDELHNQGIRVIVISGYAMPPVRVHRTAAILQKPFSASELSAALRSAAAPPKARE